MSNVISLSRSMIVPKGHRSALLIDHRVSINDKCHKFLGLLNYVLTVFSYIQVSVLNLQSLNGDTFCGCLPQYPESSICRYESFHPCWRPPYSVMPLLAKAASSLSRLSGLSSPPQSPSTSHQTSLMVLSFLLSFLLKSTYRLITCRPGSPAE